MPAAPGQPPSGPSQPPQACGVDGGGAGAGAGGGVEKEPRPVQEGATCKLPSKYKVVLNRHVTGVKIL